MPGEPHAIQYAPDCRLSVYGVSDIAMARTFSQQLPEPLFNQH